MTSLTRRTLTAPLPADLCVLLSFFLPKKDALLFLVFFVSVERSGCEDGCDGLACCVGSKNTKDWRAANPYGSGCAKKSATDAPTQPTSGYAAHSV